MTPKGIVGGSVLVRDGRIVAITPRAIRTTNRINLHGAYLAPGFIDLHVWGEPRVVSQDAAKSGTTAFLTTLGPASPQSLLADVEARARTGRLDGAACLGIHLEGPFVNPARGGALPRRSMRRPAIGELERLAKVARGRLRLITIAPELPGALEAIRWCRRHGVVVSLGHSTADAAVASRAVEAGARAVTHVFNAMPPLHHRRSGLLDVALTDNRLMTMVIADGVHVGAAAFRLLVSAKNMGRIALVTDSIRRQGWDVVSHRGAYYLRNGTLAGSSLTMIRAVRNAVERGGLSLLAAVRMASEIPARLLGDRARGILTVGKRADLVAFDKTFRVLMTIVDGRIVYERGSS